MIHHVSIPARDPRHVANVLAELLNGRIYPFPGPLQGAFMVVSGDRFGTMIEVYPEDVVLLPGEEDRMVNFTRTLTVPTALPSHILLSVPGERAEIEQIGAREGWRTKFFGRATPGKPAAFHLLEFWVENRFLLEIVPSSMIREYEEYMQFDRVEAYLGAPPLAGPAQPEKAMPASSGAARPESLPILIVGAGPVGLSAALSLAQQGIPLRIIDKLPAPTNQSRAAIVQSRTLEMFERLGIVEDFLSKGVKVHGAAIYGPGGKLLARPSSDNMPTAYSYMLGLEQTETEMILTKHLAALGVQVDRNIEMLDLEDSGSQVRVRLRHKDGTESSDNYSHVLGADGARSIVRHCLGLQLEGETLDTTWITADVKIDWDRSPGEAIAFLTEEGFAFIAAMNDNRWRVIFNLHKMTPEEGRGITLEMVQKIVTERFGIKAPLYDPVWISPFSINTRMARTMRIGRVFLAGDASHVHSPIGGQGMNTGIQDALNLAWKLALVVRGQASASLLDSYNAERHANAQRLLNQVGPATRMINLRHPVPVEIRNFAIHVAYQIGVSNQMTRNFSMLNIAYPDSPITSEGLAPNRSFPLKPVGEWFSFDKAPYAGQRAPDAAGLRQGTDKPRRLFEFWKGDPRHQLLLFAGTQPKASRVQELQALGEKIAGDGEFLQARVIAAEGDGKDLLADTEGDAQAAYGARCESLYLIRPDGYIAFHSEGMDVEGLQIYLKKWYPGVFAEAHFPRTAAG